MEKGAVKKSIEKYEHKKEFREVKLKTRKSFREDQVALERRLSSYRPGYRPRMSSSGTENGVEGKSDENGNSMASELENIVLDIKSEKGEESVYSTDVVEYENTTIRNDESRVNGDVKINGHAGHVNGAYVHENGSVPNGNGRVSNGHPPMGGSLDRKANGHVPGSMTPEPRLKLSGRRIYEKNPRLTAASTEHLDNISLKGFKQNNPAHGLRLVELKQQHHQQANIVPTVPSLPIAAIPPDGNLRGFNVDEMVTIFRMLNVREDLLLRLSVNRVDGNRFSAFTDKDLESLGICNPVARYFRDKSSVRKKKGPVFML